jgi:hypothetical protein
MAAPNLEAPQTRLLGLLAPVLAKVAELAPEHRRSPEAARELEAILESTFPWAGPVVQEIGREIGRGVAEGWLCNRGDENARFSRVAKPGPSTHGLSVDVVDMIGDAAEHTHPNGEVTIGFPAEQGTRAQFEARPPAWVFLPPGSRHVPRVAGGRMHLVYFLPGGAVEWHFAENR